METVDDEDKTKYMRVYIGVCVYVILDYVE